MREEEKQACTKDIKPSPSRSGEGWFFFCFPALNNYIFLTVVLFSNSNRELALFLKIYHANISFCNIPHYNFGCKGKAVFIP